MKTFANPLKRYVTLVLVAVSGIVLLASCSKNDSDSNNPPTAGLMAFNLAPDRPSVGFALGSNQFGSVPLGYTNYTGNYLPINIGSRQVRAYDAGNGQTLATTTYSFEDSSLYSVFLVGYNGVYRNIVALDDDGTITQTPGKAWVRYVNAIADTSTRANVNIAGTTEEAVFGTVSTFKPVNAGSIMVSISSTGNFETSRSITVDENKVYTVLFVGIPGNTDPQLAPQAKFIVNGTAD